MKHLLLIVGLSWACCASPSLADDTTPPAKAAPAGAPASSPAGAATPAASAPTGASAAGAAAKSNGPPRVLVTTNMGNFVIELNSERAPLTVQHFLAYVEQGFYNGTIFHRVVPDFVIQGGGMDTDYKIKPAALRVVNESGNGLTNARGTVGAARGSDPHSSDAQFYVNLFDNANLDPNPNRWGYAVFGKVIQGMDVVDHIGNVATGSHGSIKSDVPLKPVVIERVERINGP
jgi:peptidyl-prolyl cis-trans isomerase A (cyclophilin A)